MPFVLKIGLICLWNSILPEPGQPSVQLSLLIRLTACKKAVHVVSRWYRTVYIPWVVASYVRRKGKRWLNSNPPNHRGKTITMAQLQKIKNQLSSIWAKVCVLMIVCVLSDLTWLPHLDGGRKSWYIIIIYRFFNFRPNCLSASFPGANTVTSSWIIYYWPTFGWFIPTYINNEAAPIQDVSCMTMVWCTLD